MKQIFITNEIEVTNTLKRGLCVEGRLKLKKTEDGKSVICFKQYVRKQRRRMPDRVLCQLPNGWLKESAQRIKFFSSQKKEMKPMQICFGMQRELDEAKSVVMHNSEFIMHNDGKEEQR